MQSVKDETYRDLDRVGKRLVAVFDDEWSSNGMFEKGIFPVYYYL